MTDAGQPDWADEKSLDVFNSVAGLNGSITDIRGIPCGKWMRDAYAAALRDERREAEKRGQEAAKGTTEEENVDYVCNVLDGVVVEAKRAGWSTWRSESGERANAIIEAWKKRGSPRGLNFPSLPTSEPRHEHE